MNIIVDANIVSSGILNTDGKIGNLLIESQKHFHFIAPDFLRIEIRRHYSKLMKLSGLNKTQIAEAEYRVCKYIDFISEEQIELENWQNAYKMVLDIDPDDTHYVAYAKQFKCKIWSGDKALMKGLAKKGFEDFLSTNEMYDILGSL